MLMFPSTRRWHLARKQSRGELRSGSQGANPSGPLAIASSVKSRPCHRWRTGSTVQTQTAIRLADDRVASAAMVAPLVATEDVSGLLIALRVGRSFAATDALTASRISELLALEVAREGFADRDQKHRRQAF